MVDFLIHASTREKHDKILEKVLNRAKECGMKFNKEKSTIKINKEIKFIGHLFTENGVKPDQNRVMAISKMPIPKTKQSCKDF